MNNYEHTIIIKQDLTKNDIQKLISKYKDIIQKNKGKLIKFEEWGLMNLSKQIKKNKKGYYIHFKFESDGSLIQEFEKNERIDNNVLRFLTVKVKNFDLHNVYFENKDENKKKEIATNEIS
jgi:small subunit ribosomal protein S6